MSVAIGTAVFATLALAPADSHAAACCGTSHGLGQRLGPTERAAATSGVRVATRVGSWNARGDFGAMGSGDRDVELRAEIGWLVRAHDRFQIGASVPALATFRRLGEAASSGGGVGDVTLTARGDLVPLGSTGWAPSVALTLSGLVPTGRPARASHDALASDVTGLGAGEVRPGIVLEKTWDAGWSATVAASIGFRTAFTDASGATVALGPRFQVIAAGGPTWDFGLSIAGGIVHEREGAPSIDGAPATGAGRHRTAALLFAAYDIDPQWTVLGSAQFDLPIGGLGANELVAIAPQVSIRHAWSRLP